MAPRSNGTHENTTSPIQVVSGQQPSVERTEDRDKTPRHPRWTRQETLVLIEGKKFVEERGRRGRRSIFSSGSRQIEPKWDSVSAYCRRHGVDRGPVQCRKRWSNLLSDFKKIKTWESQVQREGESFWMMRSDLRRERKLPGFFDREVYDVLDGKAFARDAYALVLVTTSADQNNGNGIDGGEAGDEDEMVEDEEAGDSQYPEFEQVAEEEIEGSSGKERVQKNGKPQTIPSPVPISEIKFQQFHHADSDPENKRQPEPCFWEDSVFQEGAKRRRQSSSESQNMDMKDLLIEALERNANLLNARFEEQKLNCQLDREQQKEQHNSLMASLTKITDALEKIANKL